MVIQDPRLDGDVLTYGIKLLAGAVPAGTGPCALFTGPSGRPLSPVFAARPGFGGGRSWGESTVGYGR